MTTTSRCASIVFVQLYTRIERHALPGAYAGCCRSIRLCLQLTIVPKDSHCNSLVYSNLTKSECPPSLWFSTTPTLFLKNLSRRLSAPHFRTAGRAATVGDLCATYYTASTVYTTVLFFPISSTLWMPPWSEVRDLTGLGVGVNFTQRRRDEHDHFHLRPDATTFSLLGG